MLLLIKSSVLKLVAYSCFLQPIENLVTLAPENTVDNAKTVWVNEQYNSLSLDEKIGQLFMVESYTLAENQNKQAVINLIKTYKIGGLIFFKGTPSTQAQWTNEYQSFSKIPLMIGIDGEWGVNMRLDKTIQYPHALTLGAIRNNQLVYETGKQIGLECKRLGIHVNFAPVVDVNNNPKNPVINDRSFGEDKYNVAIKGISLMEGMQSVGVMACAKHFPGHGDVTDDSHFSLPVINHSKERLMNLELYPFRAMINNGVGSIMAAHLNVPALDNSGLPTSLSEKVTKFLLRDTFGFNGLVFSDALNMKGVSATFQSGDLEIRAFKAGNDILLFSENVPVAISKIKAAVQSGSISEVDLEKSVKRILAAKYDAGLNNYSPINLYNLDIDLNAKQSLLLKQHLFENAITLAKNTNDMIPYRSYGNKKFALLEIGDNKYNEMLPMLNNYAIVDYYHIDKDAPADVRASMLATLNKYDRVIVSMHEMSRKITINYGIYDNSIKLVYDLNTTVPTSVCLFGSPYAARKFEQLNNILVAYEDNEYSQKACAQALFGGIPILGKMPVGAGLSMLAGAGVVIDSTYRLKYTVPEELNINASNFDAIDNIVQKAINNGATPGAQVLVAKDGKVIYNKAFGYADYNRTQKVKTSDLYDIASCTKTCATTIEAMKLYEQGKLQLDKKVADYIPLASTATIKNIQVKDLLLHEAGLTPFIPFYKKTMDDPVLKSNTYRNAITPGYTLAVANNLYINNSYPETMWDIMQNHEIASARKFVYSDLSMYITRRIMDEITANTIDAYMQDSFYYIMGLQRMTYNPLKKMDVKNIMPTENDRLFRMQTVRGYVHDPGAAMMGGVSGHAGLFANASDMASLMQMLLNGGEFAGQRFLSPSTIDFFTRKQSTISRRGYGFDKPETDPNKTNPCSDETPKSTYGHTGFTGTCVWVDPENKLTYVFLSNRVYPSAENWKLVSMSVRTDIQTAIYKAIGK
jgi:beta-glucosidase-like glycosyl hydrolase/CubicO group peptidase (beta-lactamase class C family)